MSKQASGKILIVDDYSNWRAMLAEALTRDMFCVNTCCDMSEAKKELVRNAYDVVIVDVKLNDEHLLWASGVDLLKFIKDTEPDTGVIVITAYPTIEQKELILNRYKADGYLSKVNKTGEFSSFTVNDLCTCVKYIIQHKRANNE